MNILILPAQLLLSFNYKFETCGLNTGRAIPGKPEQPKRKGLRDIDIRAFSKKKKKKSLSVHFIEQPTGTSPATGIKL